MMSKAKKSRKNAKAKQKNENSDKFKYNPYVFFSGDEISQIKSVLRIKDIATVPAVVGCVVLNKLETLQKVLKHGVDINELGPGNTTALIWAAKYKHMHLVEFLVTNGADPTIKTENGEDMLMTALEHKLWDENSFMDVWNQVKKDWNIDVNSTNKNGHTMLHIAVRRDWEKFVQILINQKADVETANSNGVTALMAACCRGGTAIATALLSAGACAAKEDHHKRTALCYAVVCGSKSNSNRPPYPLADRLVRELKAIGVFKDYVKSRIQVMHQIIEKEETSESTFEMMISVIQYLVQFTDIGMKLLLEYKIFEHLQKIMKKSTANQEKTKFLLSIIIELVFFNEQAPYFSPEVQIKLMGQFLGSELPAICLEMLKKNQCTSCFYIFLLVCTSNELGQNWLKQNYDMFKEIYDTLPPECLKSFNVDFQEERRLKLMKKKIKKLKRTLNSSELSKCKPAEIVTSNYSQTKEEIKSPELTVVSSKKTKRHTKALKAKMAKMKSLELSERRNFGSRASNESKREETIQKVEEETSAQESTLKNVNESNILTDEQANPIAWNLKKILDQDIPDDQKSVDFLVADSAIWKKSILELPFGHYYPVIDAPIKTDKNKLLLAMTNIKIAASCEDTKESYLDKELEVVIEYLRELLQVIIFRFNYTWPHGLDADFEQDFNLSESKMGVLKRQMTLELQRNFENLIISLRTLARSPKELLKQIYQLESKLLRFEVMRSEPLMAQLNPMEQIKVRISHKTLETDKVILNYIEETLNDISEENDDISLKVIEEESEPSKIEEDIVYYEEMKFVCPEPNDIDQQGQSKQSTMNDAWHLESSIESMLEEEESCAHLGTSPAPFRNKFVPPQAFPNMEQSEKEEQKEYGRWIKDIDRIQHSIDTETILNGDIRIGNPLDKRNIISKWGQSNPVILALSCNGIPLAVKKLPKLHPLCRRLKSLVIPLLGLRNTHILPYFTCDYHENELMLATPLCEYSLEEYMDLMKMKANDQSKLLGLSEMDIIRQMLSGLSFLHDRIEPITHGNLKPTNIFIEYNGVVKLAEFGILEVLYTLAEVSESSIMWFANETYEAYKKSGVLYYTTESDIQVAGMLIHYILSGGCHPFGDNYEFILQTLEIKSFAIIHQSYYKDQSVLDLLQNMLSFEIIYRPNIQQALTHVMFWSNERRWMYILTCTGIMTATPINLKDIYEAINRSAKQIRWVDEVKKKYPLVRFFAIDNTVGLLKFIRNFYEQTIISEQDVRELKSCVLENFPDLALFLRDILENTKFYKHPAFIQFLTPDSTLAL